MILEVRLEEFRLWSAKIESKAHARQIVLMVKATEYRFDERVNGGIETMPTSRRFR